METTHMDQAIAGEAIMGEGTPGNVRSATESEATVPMTDAPRRFHAMDGARTAAMLLGVFYHLPTGMTGGMGMFGMGAARRGRLTAGCTVSACRCSL